MATKNVPPSVLDELRRNLERLKLRAMANHLDEALEQAAATEQGYITFVAGLVQREVLARAESSRKRRTTTARFPSHKTFDTFDWAFQKHLNVQLVKDLQNLHFIDQGRPVLLLGKPGVGKTHMSVAYGLLAVQRGYSVRFFKASALLADLYASLADGSTERLVGRLSRVDLLIIDDLRHIPMRSGIRHAAVRLGGGAPWPSLDDAVEQPVGEGMGRGARQSSVDRVAGRPADGASARD